MKIKFGAFTFFIVLSVLLSACGTNKQDDVNNQSVEKNAAEQADITRPPKFVKRDQNNTETNPDETISLEEWRKEQSNKD